MSQIIRYANRVESTKVLGPCDRAVIWVYGCCFNCEGCVARRYRSGVYHNASVEDMTEWFLSTKKSHLTISGGEPFLQADALALLIKNIRSETDAGVVIYTGFTYAELAAKAEKEEGVKALLELADLLIDGRYVQESDDGRPYIGSSNQQIIPLTDRYADEIEAYYGTAVGRQIELRFDSEKTVLIGVPSAEQRKLWEHLKQIADGQQKTPDT